MVLGGLEDRSVSMGLVLEMEFEDRRVTVGFLSSMVVLGLINIDDFVIMVSRIDEGDVYADQVGESFLVLLANRYGVI